ncbi:MAG: hypothetical protein IPL59_25490 [Candidatus Competibacteraceae bacterium]|nr:hypothetical protein [Candidatus Contendobacter odensis]MBK8538143.1 hypothetical protein [Candidatus Competibacteraceae bacterium]MBK8752682.1 hypothetical protein [Candidatus Competibacteraceae bacterium]
MIEEWRQMGNEALTVWAERGAQKPAVFAPAESEWPAGGKKNGIGTAPWVGSK